jgi:histidinol-phosphate aminotransferase
MDTPPLNERLNSLKAYIPGRGVQEIAKQYGLPENIIVKLGSNENPLGVSPKAVQAVSEMLKISDGKLNLYPDALGENIADAIKSKFPQIGDASVITGNGMDNVLEGISRLLLSKGSQALIHTPTFEYYEIVTRWSEAEPVFVPSKPENDFAVDLDEMALKLNDRVKLVFLCNPNNPTGFSFLKSDIKNFLEIASKNGTFVFLDEAYTEFNGLSASMIDEVKNYDNLIIGRTFSKLYGLAALRVGWGVVPKHLLTSYRKTQTPFSTNKLGQAAAVAALFDDDFVERSLKVNEKEREKLSQRLKELGFKVFSSGGNFVPFLAGEKFENSAQSLCEGLLHKGIIARNASTFRDAPKNLVRITVGTPEMNDRFLNELKTLTA